MSKHRKPKQIAPKLRAIRNNLALSQSEMMHLLGMKCCYGRISEYERGKRVPTVLTLLDYARLGGIHIDDLVDDEIELKF